MGLNFFKVTKVLLVFGALNITLFAPHSYAGKGDDSKESVCKTFPPETADGENNAAADAEIINGVMLRHLGSRNLDAQTQHLNMLFNGLTPQTSPDLGQTNGVTAIAIDDSRSLMALATADNKIQLWSVSSIDNNTGASSLSVFGQLKVSFESNQARISTIAFSGDGSVLLTGAVDGSVKVWTGVGNAPIVLSHPAPVKMVSISPDKQLIAVSLAERNNDGVEIDNDNLALWKITPQQPELSVRLYVPALDGAKFNPSGNLYIFSNGFAKVGINEVAIASPQHPPP